MAARTSEPSFTVRDEYLRVPARDGLRLHARLWRPVSDERLPVVVNLDPYRSSDMRTLGRGDIFHWLARHGYIVAHVSARGTDASEGIAEDEYSPNEQRDGYDAVEWFGSQPWCNGNVAAIGTSYSAFTAIQIAAQQPPHLKAIVPICGTDDRYTDDVHYHGGLLHVGDNVMTYGVSMLAVNALPTLPEHGGIDWLDAWTARLDSTPFWLPIWMEHQRDGAYWRSGSLAPNWERIRAATLICGGWHDAYRNAGMRMLAKLTAPKRAIMGPWTHGYPDFNAVGPSGDFSGEMIAWLDRWLKGIDNGVERELVLIAYMQEHASFPGKKLIISDGVSTSPGTVGSLNGPTARARTVSTIAPRWEREHWGGAAAPGSVWLPTSARTNPCRWSTRLRRCRCRCMCWAIHESKSGSGPPPR